jgi:GDP-L-fucose synthase
MRVMITGGSGFLGKALTRLFKVVHPDYDIVSLSSKDYNLVNKQEAMYAIVDHRPDVLVHLAARVGGIGANKDNPGKFFYDNICMGINIIESARLCKVKKFIQIGTVCSYPKHTPVPFSENSLWHGYPEETNAPYGIAKKALLTMLQSYREQYNFNGIYLIPTNLYGPGDNFHLQTSHVIPAIIRKVALAKQVSMEKVLLWGSGDASREFLYVDDCANAIILAINKYNGKEPINLGSNEEITILELASKIAGLIGYSGSFVWDSSRPDGQPRRWLDTRCAQVELSWLPAVSLEEGLKNTINWYYKEKFNADIMACAGA